MKAYSLSPVPPTVLIPALLATCLANPLFISDALADARDNRSDNSRSANQGSRFGVGLGTIVQDKGYVGVDSDTMAVPIIYYQSKDFYLLGPTFGYKFARLDGAEFKLTGQVRFGGYDEEDGDIFVGMDEKSITLDLGIGVDYKSDYGDFAFQFSTDALGEHKGNELSISYSKSYRMKGSMITPYVSIARLSEDVVDYYYGVNANEVTTFRGFYEGETTTNVEVGVRYNQQFGRNHSVMLNAGYTAFGQGIKDSPLIEKSSSTTVILGYMYMF